MQAAIEVQALRKQYGENKVLQSVSLQVKKGEVFALLGTNGAGKTTTLECIEGLRGYDSGKIVVNGKIGVQLQSSSLADGMRVKEAILFFAKWAKAEVPKEIVQRLGLEEMQKKEYRQLSTGQKRRLHLALALLGNPDTILLDEPTAGLDVEARATLHDEIRSLRQSGKTVILASHDMAEVESLCDTIAILHKGKIVFCGSPQELHTRSESQRNIRIRTAQPMQKNTFAKAEYREEKQGYSVYKVADIGAGVAELLAAAKQQGVAVLDLQVEQATLEQRFLELAKGDGV